MELATVLFLCVPPSEGAVAGPGSAGYRANRVGTPIAKSAPRKNEPEDCCQPPEVRRRQISALV